MADVIEPYEEALRGPVPNMELGRKVIVAGLLGGTAILAALIRLKKIKSPTKH